MRELRIQLEQELETENRVAEARQARVDRGERPFTELELRDGYDPDGPSGLRPPAPRRPTPRHSLLPLASRKIGRSPSVKASLAIRMWTSCCTPSTARTNWRSNRP